MAITSETVHFTFTSYLSAAEALLAVMEDMRTTRRWYRLIGRSPEALLRNGMTLEGEISEVSDLISSIPGANRPFS